MPKHRIKDRPYLSALEWSNDFGGYKKKRQKLQGNLPFECCALSLQPFVSPALVDGVLFEYEAILKFVQEKKKSPVTGKSITSKEIIQLNMKQNDEGQWHCPVSFRVFGPHTKVGAVLTSRNVYGYQVVKQLCTGMNTKDLLDPTVSFDPSNDLIKIYDTDDTELCKLRDLSNFHHLEEERQLFCHDQRHQAGRVNHSASSLRILEEVRRCGLEDKKKKPMLKNDQASPSLHTSTFWRVKALKPTTMDVREASRQTGGKTSGALTSTMLAVSTSAQLREATDEEILEARWRQLRSLRQYGYLRLETSLGPLNFEIRADVVPAASENFLALCRAGRFDHALFYRVIKGFMAQAGDTANRSAWNRPFKDEFDSRLSHDARGILAYANPSRKDANTSQFYITFAPCQHLDNRHTVFGKLVGGFETLDLIESIPTDDDDRPMTDIKILQATVFQDPTPQADAAFEKYVRANIQKHQERTATTQPSAPRPSERRIVQPKSSTSASSGDFKAITKKQQHTTSTIGKYLKKKV